MIQNITEAITIFFQWPNPMWMLAGVSFGMIIGILPGMAGSVAIALLIPVSFTLEPSTAVLFLMAAYSPAAFGGMITSVFVNTPGTPENAATIFDGHPMAKQGRAAAAMGAATTSSVLGGILGIIILLALLPVAQNFVLAFSYPEFFMMAIFGLAIIAAITKGAFMKGISAALFGLLVAFIGSDPIFGEPRFTLGQPYLWDGIDIVPVIIGLFAGSEVLTLFGENKSIADDYDEVSRGGSVADTHMYPVAEAPVTFLQGTRSAFRHWFLVIRGSVIGTVIGIIPGVGGALPGFVSYAHAKQTSKHPEEFGHGNVEGLISVEASHNAKDGGALLPTVAFGIPGTVGMAILLGALVMQGIQPGPELLIDHLDLVYMLILSLLVAHLVAPLFVVIIARFAKQITSLRAPIFTPLIVIAVLVGVYTVRLEYLDIVVTLIFAYIGYAMHRYGFSRIAATIAIVLGSMIERSYFQTVNTYGDLTSIITRPISLVLMLLVVGTVAAPVISKVRMKRSHVVNDDVNNIEGASDTGEIIQEESRQLGRIVFNCVMLSFGILIVVLAFKLGGDPSKLPLLVGMPFCLFMVAETVGSSFPGSIESTVSRIVDVRRAPRFEDEMSNDSENSDGSLGVVRYSEASTWSQTDLIEQSSSPVIRRQIVFAAWSVGVTVIAWIFGFLLAVPLGLILFLKVIAKESWRLSVLLTLGGCGFFYLLYVQLLGLTL